MVIFINTETDTVQEKRNGIDKRTFEKFLQKEKSRKLEKIYPRGLGKEEISHQGISLGVSISQTEENKSDSTSLMQT